LVANISRTSPPRLRAKKTKPFTGMIHATATSTFPSTRRF
jgi:hypothetical protein